MNIIVCTPDRKEELETVVRIIPAVKEFIYLWNAWGNWEKHPPIMAVEGYDEKGFFKIAGFWAYTYSIQRQYINSYYHAVVAEYRGKGVAGKMFEYLLQGYSATRIKFRTHWNSDGNAFWRGFGFRPFASIGIKEYVWDEDISMIGRTGLDVVEWNGLRQFHNPIPDYEMKKYLKLKDFHLLEEK